MSSNKIKKNTKQYIEICEQINNIDLEIEFNKKFNLDYSNLIIEKNRLLRKLNGVIK